MSHQSVGEPIMHSNSNAVLTPELIHPNFFRMTKKLPHTTHSKRNPKQPKPLSSFENSLRQRWVLNQSTVMALLPSNAVLGD